MRLALATCMSARITHSAMTHLLHGLVECSQASIECSVCQVTADLDILVALNERNGIFARSLLLKFVTDDH